MPDGGVSPPEGSTFTRDRVHPSTMLHVVALRYRGKSESRSIAIYSALPMRISGTLTPSTGADRTGSITSYPQAR